MPTFITIGRRLVMRYDTGSFSFNNIRTNATDTGMYNLSKAFASIQEKSPRKVSAIITRQVL